MHTPTPVCSLRNENRANFDQISWLVIIIIINFINDLSISPWKYILQILYKHGSPLAGI